MRTAPPYRLADVTLYLDGDRVVRREEKEKWLGLALSKKTLRLRTRWMLDDVIVAPEDIVS